MMPKSKFIRFLFSLNICIVALFIWIIVSKKHSLFKYPSKGSHAPSLVASSSSAFLKTVSANQDWSAHPFLRNLRKFPTLKVFAKLSFSHPITPRFIKKCSKLGADFSFPSLINKTILPSQKLLGFSHAIALLTPVQMQRIRELSFITDMHILVQFSAIASYKLNIWLDGPQETVVFNISLPYGRYGHLLQSRIITLEGMKQNFVQSDQNIIAHVDTAKNRVALFSSQVEFLVNIDDLLDHHIRVWGDNVSLQEYRALISRSPFTSKFTETNQNIQFCDYVEEFVKTINPQHSLQSIWNSISKKLNFDISYDWKKKSDFFSGNLPYSDIKDMYLTCSQLSVMRLGACPERSALEVAILRRLGVPSRTVTRLFHIYAQIYTPQLGWISTSANVRQIPLCESFDSNISYFVSWSPKHPVRIKWTGDFFPKEF